MYPSAARATTKLASVYNAKAAIADEVAATEISCHPYRLPALIQVTRNIQILLAAGMTCGTLLKRPTFVATSGVVGLDLSMCVAHYSI